METITKKDIELALATVIDPELSRSIADLNMIDSIAVATSTAGTTDITVEIKLTVASCPWRTPLEASIREKLTSLDGAGKVTLSFSTMTKAELEAIKVKLRGPEPDIPFNSRHSKTRIIAITSGKGGVGKSSITANLAALLALQGCRVGVLDADIYGFSQPHMLGVTQSPTMLNDMILPIAVPLISKGHRDLDSHEKTSDTEPSVKVISSGMLQEIPNQPVAVRGPLLHSILSSFLSQVYWGELDYLLIDLPPGTGDIALSIAQLLPKSQSIVVTTPQGTATEAAQRSGLLSSQTGQDVIGVIENMSWFVQPDGSTLHLFGDGGGLVIAKSLSQTLNQTVPLMGQVPLDIALREGADAGRPVVVTHPDSPAAKALRDIADRLTAFEQDNHPQPKFSYKK